MITVIIASNREANFLRVRQNINETIGLPFQLVRMQDLNKGIGHSYNAGVLEAIHDILFFLHDDILFHSNNWGQQVINYLQDPASGAIGIMGGRYKSAFGTGWRDGETGFYRMQVLDGAAGGRMLCQNPGDVLSDEVICLDGAFLCTKKSTWAQFPFDEINFKGFHFYDLDWSLQLHLAGLKNRVVFDILLEHFSQGNRDISFLKDFILFQNKWKNHLPASIENLKRSPVIAYEGYALAETLQLMKRNGFTKTERWHQLKRYFRLHKNWYHTLRCAYFGFLK